MLNVIPRRIQQLYMKNMVSSLGEGVVLYIDISGFTTMTESLLGYGRKGAEALSGILNRTFSRAIEEIYAHSGEIADFEGDAIIAVFPSDSPELALGAAHSIEGYFRRRSRWRTDLGDWPVTCRISLASGSTEWRIIGGDRLAFFLGGSGILRAIGTSRACLSESLVFHDSYSALVRRKTGIFPEELHPGDAVRTDRRPVRIRRSVAGRFVSQSILSSRLTGEFRTVSPVFVNIADRETPVTLAQAERVMEAAMSYGGEPSAFYITDRSFLTGLVLFGAPVSMENDTERAFDFAAQLQSELGDSFRAGVSRGTTYAGIIGNSRRCRYSVYGDTVNTASRLVSRARFGEVLVTRGASEGGRGAHLLSGSRRWLPRGKTDEIIIHRLQGRKPEGSSGSFRGKMLGREEELRELVEGLQVLTEGVSAGLTVVHGDPGAGKSRLIHEAANRVGFECQSFLLKCDDILRKSLNPFVHFLRDFFDQREEQYAHENKRIFEERMLFLLRELRECGSSSARLQVEVERISSILGALLGHHWAGSVFSRLAAESRLENSILAIMTLMEALAMLKPSLFILDDIQWMDGDSRRALALMTSAMEQIPIAFLASCRLADDGSMRSIPSNCIVKRDIQLSGLDDRSVRGIISDRLGGEPDPSLAAYITDQSSGNPFYVQQYCMYLLESGQISRESGRYRLRTGSVEIPSGIRSILVARMDRLPERVRRFMQTASVLGREFSADTLRMVSGGEDEGDLLDEGERLQLWTRQSGPIFAFNHSLYRDTAYGMLLGKSLRKIHAKAADVLIELHRDNHDPVAGEIALHLRESGQTGRAVDWGWRALCHAIDSYQNSDALRWSGHLFQWLIDDSDEGSRNPLLLDVLLKRDRVLHTMGRREDQQENLETLRDLMVSESWTDRTAEVLRAAGTYAWSIGEVDRAYELFREGLSFTRRSSDESIRGRLLGNIGNILSVRGRFVEAQEYYEKALRIHRSLADRKQEGITLGNLAILQRRWGDLDKARKSYEKALAIHRSSGNRIGEGRVLCGLGNLAEDPAEALAQYAEALSINREIGDRRNEAIILSNLGRLQTDAGEYSKAAEYLDAALDIHRQIGNREGEADTNCLFGEMYYARSMWQQAAEHLRAAISISRSTGNAPRECIYMGLLGLVCFESGGLSETQACYDECYRLIEEGNFPKTLDDSFLIMRDKLLGSGTDPSNLPYPSHWGSVQD